MTKVYNGKKCVVLTFLSIFISVASSFSLIHIRPSFSSLSAAQESIRRARNVTGLCIEYSPSFQRHIIVNNSHVVASYEFLDEARAAHPSAIRTPLVPGVAQMAGGGLEESAAYSLPNDIIVEEARKTLSIWGPPEKLVDLSRERWLPPEQIRSNYGRLESLLQTMLDLHAPAQVVAIFPHVLLYDSQQVEDRLRFFLAPLPETKEDDWPLIASRGYGAGWTVDQVRRALMAVPHIILAMHMEDAATMRPPLFYFLSAVPYEKVDEARLEMGEGGDVYSFALLSHMGIGWEHLHAVLNAFPCLDVCDTEPTWEMMGRSVLKEDALHYLQRRLQIRPATVQAMIKTHSRLSTYNVATNIKPTLDGLQSKLGFSSRELRKVVLRMPSLIGMSVEESRERGLLQRLHFFYDEVGMSPMQLRKAVLQQPSLLQYSVERTLRPKLDYFVEELCVPWTEMPRVILKQPSLMGNSLEETLRPTANALMETCGFSSEELGDLISRAPSVLTLSWKRKIEPTLKYLQNRLGLSQPQLREFIFTSPRILKHSIPSSLEPKLQMLQAALEKDGSQQQATQLVTANLALLVTSKTVFEQRLQHSLGSNLTRTFRPAFRRKRSVLEMDAQTNEVDREFPSAKAAAKELQTSVPNMYNICNTGRLWRGKKYIYRETPNANVTSFVVSDSPAVQNNKPVTDKGPLLFKGLRGALAASSQSTTKNKVHIVVYVSGRVFPPDDANQVRGMRRAGGMVLYFPQVHQYQLGPELSTRLRLAAENSFGQIMPLNEGRGTCYHEGRILIGFPYLKPSLRRCELYACHDALKVVFQLLKYESTLVSLADDVIDIDIYTDSDYAWKLLHNTTRLHAFGENERGFVKYEAQVNPDLLQPLCRTYYRLIHQEDSDGKKLELGKEVRVSFRHAGGINMRELHNHARQAAMWMDRRAKTAIIK